MTSKQKLEILIEHFYDKKTNTIDLSGLNCKNMNINLSHIKANHINNDNQQAIRNIWNNNQKADSIYNDYQMKNKKNK